MRNRFIANLATIAMLGSGLSLLASPAHAESQPELEEHSRAFVNEQRSQRGIAALKPDAQLTAAARRHAERMAADADIYHNSRLSREVDGFDRLAENVGVGWSVEAVDDAFMASEGHRLNILGSFTRVGLGIVEREGDIFIVQVFGRLAPKSKPSAQESKHHNHNHKHKKKPPAKPKPQPTSTPTPEPEPPTSPSPEPTPSQEPTPDPSTEPTPEASGSPSPEPTASSGKSFPLPEWLTS